MRNRKKQEARSRQPARKDASQSKHAAENHVLKQTRHDLLTVWTLSLLQKHKEVSSVLMQVTRTTVRTSCTETQVRTASLVPPLSHFSSRWHPARSSTLRASSPLAPLAAHFTPPLLLRGERERVGGRMEKGVPPKEVEPSGGREQGSLSADAGVR